MHCGKCYRTLTEWCTISPKERGPVVVKNKGERGGGTTLGNLCGGDNSPDQKRAVVFIHQYPGHPIFYPIFFSNVMRFHTVTSERLYSGFYYQCCSPHLNLRADIECEIGASLNREL